MASEGKMGNQPETVGLQETYTDFTLGDVVRFIGRHVLLLSVGTLLGLGVGVAAWCYLPSVWMTEVILRVGRPPAGMPLPIDQPPELMEKIKSSQFLSFVGARVEKNEEGAGLYVDLASRRLKVIQLGGGDLLQITVPGRSGAQAYEAATQIAQKMIADQAAQLLPFEQLVKTRILAIDAALLEHGQLNLKLQDMENDAASKHDSSKLVLLLAMRDREAAEVRRLERDKAEFENTQLALGKSTVSIFSRGGLPYRPSSPRLTICLLLAGLGGFVLATMLAGIRHISVMRR